jgi:hypothetical protein
MPEPTLAHKPARGPRLAALVAALAVVGVGAVYAPTRPEPSPGNSVATDDSDDKPAAPPKPATVGGLKLFATWPTDRTPDLVFVLSGQTYGYLSPCGCSSPQKGGLERRANLISDLQAKGWPVVGLDLGDVAPAEGVHRQNLLKYKTTMRALAAMGYVGVGLGKYDFDAQLFELLSAYTLNNPGKPPTILAANLRGAQRDMTGKVTKLYTREEFFPGGDEKAPPMIEGGEVVALPGRPPFAVVSVIGPTVADEVVKADKMFDFPREADGKVSTGDAIRTALAKIDRDPQRPQFRVLMYVGKIEEAQAAATAFPQFQLVLCQSDDSLPPTFPTPANDGRTQIVQVGHKGQSVGVVGLFRSAAGFELKYQLVELGEEYKTPPGEEAAKANAVLQLMEEYTKAVRDENLLALHTAKQIQHATQIQHPAEKATYVGAAACAKCHAAEYAKWGTTKHSHAYEALEKVASRPSLRQFDGECLVCHTTGMKYQSGFKDAVKTPELKNNGCENCHGPGSAHAAKPNDKGLLASLSPWRTKPTDKLPDPATMAAIGKVKEIDRGPLVAKLTASQREVIDKVYGLCRTCHDPENDPKFDLYEYMPKVYHSNLKSAGLPADAK